MSHITREQLSELLAQDKAGRVTRENLQAYLKNPDLVLEAGAKSSISDLIPKGWAVVEDTVPSMFDISKLKPRSFLKNGEDRISGGEMRKRAVKFKATLGLADGKRLLAEQDKIPAEFRGYYIPLPGTILRDSGGGHHVPCLCFDGDRWVLDFCWLGIDWSGCGRFACCE